MAITPLLVNTLLLAEDLTLISRYTVVQAVLEVRAAVARELETLLFLLAVLALLAREIMVVLESRPAVAAAAVLGP